MRSVLAVCVIAAYALLVSGCAKPPIPVSRTACVIAGGVIGGFTGVVTRNNSDDHDPNDDEDNVAAGAVGAAAGAALGALLCGKPEAPPPPPPPPPPAPAPRATPPPPPPAARIVLRGVNFDFDKATIRPDAEVTLDAAADVLKENPNVRVEVAGHTDATGPDDYNQKLSERRAQSVVDYLAKKGVGAERLHAAGYGESKPVADNGTKDGRAQNRRVELNVE